MTHLQDRETGFYWVQIDGDWFLTKYNSKEDMFYFPGLFDGVAPTKFEIDENRLDKKFEGYKRKTPDSTELFKITKQEGYYWVLHDAMWFVAYYLSSKDEFFLPGQVIGFDSSEFDEIEKINKG